VSWAVVARKDFEDAIRSRGLIALTVLFVLFCGGMAYLYTIVGVNDSQAANVIGFVTFLFQPAAFLVPIIGLVVGYKAIAGERESGSIKLLLGLPHTRQDVVAGKVVGRAAVVTVSILVGFLVGAVVVLALYGSFSVTNFALFTLLTVILALAFVSVGVGISAATGSTNRAVIGIIAFFVLFRALWGEIPKAINYLLNGTYGFPNSTPEWLYLFRRLNPSNAYQGAVSQWLFDNSILQALFGGDVPFALSPWVALAILFAWILLPAGVGYLAFERADL
jgi:ABC-2 type transport system permease protein